MKLNEKTAIKGWTTRRLYDTEKYNLAVHSYSHGRITKEEFEKALDEAAKPMFKNNGLWMLLKKLFNVDLQIPFLTGFWTKKAITANLVTTRGKRVVADQIGGTTTAPVTAIALGIGTTAANAADTALESEIIDTGLQRGAATVTNTTTTTTGDTEQWVKTFTATGSKAVTEEGLFDNNTSGGNMLARQVFSAINVANTDTLQITHKVQVS